MKLAVSAANSTQLPGSSTVPIIILGTDAVLAASPSTPVQLAHACLRAGFANVVPASWGDEIVAAAVLRRLPRFGSGPVIQCSCPIVAHRLLTVGGDLRPVLLPLVPPPVAAARYVRALAQPTRTRITYVGACPGAIDDSIDIRMTPDALIAMLAERDIVIADQPQVFESIIPPDRRRFRSQPGGVPSAEALWTELGSRTLVEVDGEDFVTEIAQLLLGGRNILIDTSGRLGCACSGAVNGVRHSRGSVIALEPPRSTTPVVDEEAPIDLDLPVPATSRTPVDIVAVPTTPPSSRSVTPPNGIEAQVANPHTTAGASTHVPDSRSPRPNTPSAPRALMGALPIARDADGRSLPRAYVVARRRSNPKGTSVALSPPEDAATESTETNRRAEPTAPEPRINTQPAEPAPPETYVPLTASSQPMLPAPVIAPTPTKVEVRTPVALAPEPALPGVVAPPEAAPAPVASATATPTPSLSPVTAYTPDASAARTSSDQPRSAAAPASNGSARESAETPTRRPRLSDARPTAPGTWTMSRKQLIVFLFAIAIVAISVSTIVAIIVGRSITDSVITR
jgi:hypothetical protein